MVTTTEPKSRGISKKDRRQWMVRTKGYFENWNQFRI